MADDQHALTAMVQADRIQRAAQAQDDVTPAFSAWRPVRVRTLSDTVGEFVSDQRTAG
jgi:hypothetical protein